MVTRSERCQLPVESVRRHEGPTRWSSAAFCHDTLDRPTRCHSSRWSHSRRLMTSRVSSPSQETLGMLLSRVGRFSIRLCVDFLATTPHCSGVVPVWEVAPRSSSWRHCITLRRTEVLLGRLVTSGRHMAWRQSHPARRGWRSSFNNTVPVLVSSRSMHA